MTPTSAPARRLQSLAGRAIALTLALLLVLPTALPPVVAQEAPTLLAPGNGDVITPTAATPLAIPEFRWTAVAGATSYRLQFANNAGMAAPFEFTTANTAYTPLDAAGFTDGTWYWRVKVDRPTASQYSSVVSFSKQWAVEANRPALSEPADGTTLAFYAETEFSWEPVLGASSFRLQIAASAEGFGSPLYNVETLAPVHQPNAKRANGTYYWRVVPFDSEGRAGSESLVRSFIVSYDEAPTLLEPPNGPTTFTPTFLWTAVQGAGQYTLEYATDTAFTAELTRLTTNNTSYTPVDDLENDKNYYWRVRAVSGISVGPWSEVRQFVKQWYLQPVLLTPTNSYTYVHEPFFSWTPVPGARAYRIEIHTSPSFPLWSGSWATGVTSNPYYSLVSKIPEPGLMYFWRVTPLDANGNKGEESQTASFKVTAAVEAPQLASPLYYYVPNNYGAGTETGPTEDRTAAYPLFVWQRVVSGSGQAAAYRLQVSASPLFTLDVWEVDTPHLWATPTASDPFDPLPGTDYFWRVTALDAGSTPTGEWSQVWRARFDASRGLSPEGPIPDPLRPADGSEWAETAPYLEWRPVDGATAYEIEVARDSAMTDVFLSDAASHPLYAPRVPFVYDGDPVTELPYGTWYWRVRVQGTGDDGWSAVQRFQIAANSHWKLTRAPGDPANRWQIGGDPAGDAADAAYDLTRLDVSQSKDWWLFGFPLTEGGGDRSYVLYLDVDHVDGSGATTGLRVSPGLAYSATTVASHRPEYAIHVPFSGGAPSVALIAVYPWDAASGAWGTPTSISPGGVITYTGGYLEMHVPTTVIAPALGRDEKTSSLAVSLFSASGAGGSPVDSVPSDPGVPGAPTVLSRFASVTERMTVSAPPNVSAEEGALVPSVPPFFWNLNLDAIETDWCGYRVQGAVDDKFSTVVIDYTYGSSVGRLPYMQANSYDFDGDNTYYWRARPVYCGLNAGQGAWSEPFRFERDGFVPTNLGPAGTEAAPAVMAFTPRFQWDLVEGALQYDLEVSTDKTFGTRTFYVYALARNQYTWTSTLAPGTYHWRVRITRLDDGTNDVINDWSPVQTFTVSLPVPGELRAVPTATLGAPTLCWEPVIASDSDSPVLAAWKYRVQVSRDPTFTTIWDTVDTEQICWTPTKGYYDGDYWWRVAMIDGAGRLGAWSGASTFRKAYPLPTGLSQTPGPGTPTFSWAPVDGAASYKVEVSAYAGFNVILDSVTTNNTRWTPTKVYTTLTTWYWRVAMIDKDGRQGSSEFRVVTLENPMFLPRVSVR